MPRKIAVVTGGAGFLGSHLVTRLLEKEWRVRVVDDLSSGALRNIASVKDDISMKKANILDRAALEKAMAGSDVVFHLAAKVSAAESMEKPELYARVNIAGTVNVLEAASKEEVGRVVFQSSAAVYGEEKSLPKKESSPLVPASPYAVTKLLGEALCQVYKDREGIETTVLRTFNIYGPRQDPKSPYASVIPKFLDALSHGRRPIVYGDGRQTRDFIHVDDAVNALHLAATKKGAVGEIFNIASGKQTSVLELLDVMKKAGGWDVKPKFEAERPGEVRHSYASIDKARNNLGFRPKVTLNRGIKNLVKESRKSKK